MCSKLPIVFDVGHRVFIEVFLTEDVLRQSPTMKWEVPLHDSRSCPACWVFRGERCSKKRCLGDMELFCNFEAEERNVASGGFDVEGEDSVSLSSLLVALGEGGGVGYENLSIREF